MELLNFGVVGLGEQSTDNLIPALLAIPKIRLVAVCDLDSEKVRGFTQRLGVSGYADFHEMLDSENLDVVLAACSPQVHYELALECLNRGLHVFLEKPPCAQTYELQNLIAKASTRPDLATGVGLNFDYSQSIGTIDSLIRQAQGAKQISIEYAASKPRGPLWGLSPTRSFLLAQVIHALGIALSLNAGYSLTKSSFEVAVDEAYVFAQLALRFANGNLVTLITGNSYPNFELKIKAVGRGLVIELDNLRTITVRDEHKASQFGLQKRWCESSSPSPIATNSRLAGYLPELEEFVECIFQKRQFSANFSALLPNYKIMDQLEMEIENARAQTVAPTAQTIITDKYQPSSKQDLEEIQKAISRGSLSGTSDTVILYGNALANYFASKHAIPVSSGSAALTVAIHGARLRPGDEVILAPTCPLCTVYPLLEAGLVPVFCDTNETNFGLNIEGALEKLITTKTKALIDVPMWGYPTPAKALWTFANERQLVLIRDAAQAHGTLADGESIARNCHIACFSTHDRKLIATGEGGFILTDDDTYADRMRSFIQFGYLAGENLGLNFKLNALSAAVGISRLALLDNQIATRAQNASYIKSKLRTDGLVQEFPFLQGSSPNYYTLLLLIEKIGEELHFIQYLSENGVPSDILRYKCRPVYEFPRLQQYSRPCPAASRLMKRITTVPVHPGLSQNHLDTIVATINSY